MKKRYILIVDMEDICRNCPYLDTVFQDIKPTDPLDIQFYCTHHDNKKLLKDSSSLDSPMIPDECPLPNIDEEDLKNEL